MTSSIKRPFTMAEIGLIFRLHREGWEIGGIASLVNRAPAEIRAVLPPQERETAA